MVYLRHWLVFPETRNENLIKNTEIIFVFWLYVNGKRKESAGGFLERGV